MKLSEILENVFDAGEMADQAEFQDPDFDVNGQEERGSYRHGPKRDKASGDNMKKARRVAKLARVMSRASNPDNPREPSGWNADPHQGGHFSSFLNRGGHG